MAITSLLYMSNVARQGWISIFTAEHSGLLNSDLSLNGTSEEPLIKSAETTQTM